MSRLCTIAPFAALLLCACETPDTAAPLPLGELRQAQVLEVPGRFATLQAAVQAAQPGDVIRVGPGDFGADVSIAVRDLTIEGPGPEHASLRRSLNIQAPGFTIRDIALRADGVPFGLHLNGRGATVTARNIVVEGYRFGILVTDAALDVEGAVVIANQTGVYLTDARGRFANSTVVNNTRGGIVTRSGAQVTIEHNTVVGNAFAGTGEAAGGVALGPGGVEVVRNNIIVGNNDGLNCSGCSATVRRNDVWGNVTDYAGNVRRGQDDLSVDPRFVNPAERNFRLRAGSPCIDAALAGGPATDATGAPRPAGAGADLGAYEYQPPTANLVVNEVMANPLDEGTGEYVEIYNAGNAPVDLAGYHLDDGDAIDVIVPYDGRPTVLPPGGYAVILDRDYAGQYTIPAAAVLVTVPDARLGNALAVGDPIYLRAPDRNTIVSRYEPPFDPGNGVSAERNGDRFVPSPCGASPGAPNCAAAPPEPSDATLLITEVMANPLDEATGEYIELINLGEDPIDLAGYVLSDGDAEDVLQGYAGGSTVVPGGGRYAVILDRDFAGDYDLPPGVTLLTVGDGRLGNSLATDDPITLRDPEGALVGSFSYPFNPGNGVSAELISLDAGDRAGAWLASPCGASPGRPNCTWEAEPEPPPALQITEVMANPNNEDTGEFVEIRNTGATPIDAAGLLLSDGDAVDTLQAFHPGGSTLIPPGGYALILDPEFNDDYPIPGHVVLLRPADTTIGSGLAVNDPIELMGRDGTVIDAFDRPFDPGNGHSAERSRDGSWVRSPCARSPGWANCVDRPIPTDPRSCRLPADCPAELRCIGITGDGQLETGRCADLRPHPGDGARCAAHADCADHLVCLGTTLFPEDAFCVPDYLRGTYSTQPHQPIPDNQPAGVASPLLVYGLASVPGDVWVRVSITHANPAQLLITLEDPNGGSAVIFDGARDPAALLRTAIPAYGTIARDDRVNGQWTLRVVDRAAGTTGTFYAWVLDIVSNWD